MNENPHPPFSPPSLGIFSFYAICAVGADCPLAPAEAEVLVRCVLVASQVHRQLQGGFPRCGLHCDETRNHRKGASPHEDWIHSVKVTVSRWGSDVLSSKLDSTEIEQS